MNTNTRARLLALLRSSGGARPHDLAQQLQISNVALHKHIKHLLANKLISRRGTPPRVTYIAFSDDLEDPIDLFTPQNINQSDLYNSELERIRERLEHSFCYFTPSGQELHGAIAIFSLVLSYFLAS